MQTFLERLVAGGAMLVLAPVFILVTIVVAAEDGLPVIFRQKRIGRGGHPFELLKFRSMRAAAGAKVTAAQDPRVTRVGKFLRRYKIDELPQLWNVVAGDMALIGPRPEVAEFVDLSHPLWREVLSVRPGITDLTSLVYRDEEVLLSTAENPVKFYRGTVLPAKLELAAHYLRVRSFWTDLRLLMLTLRYSFIPSGFDPQLIRQKFNCEERVTKRASVLCAPALDERNS